MLHLTQDKPLVTFIVAASNQPILLKAALSSCLAQTFERWEAIVVDDHSEPPLYNVVSSFNDKRIKYYRLPLGLKGISAARNTALSLATTDILITLDSDDLNIPLRAARCYQLLNRCDPCLIYTRVRLFSTENPIGCPKRVFQPYNPILLQMFNFVTNAGTAFNKKAYHLAGGYYDLSLSLAEDYELYLRMSLNGVHIAGVDEEHVYYRKHDASLTFNNQLQLHESIMYIRTKHMINPFSFDEISLYAHPSLWENLRNNTEAMSIWIDDRYSPKS